MKRSGPPERRTPLRRNAALRPGDGLKASGKGLDRRTPLKSVSGRRRSEGADRARVRADVLTRDGSCRAWLIAPGPCWLAPDYPVLDVHEVISRARRPGSHLEPDLCLAVCRGHHDWITTHPAEAERRGLALPSTATDADVAEAVRTRDVWRQSAALHGKPLPDTTPPG